MTNTPNPNNEPQNSANRRIWLLWLSRSGFAFGAIVLVGIAAGAWWAWIFVQEQLAPLVEKNLSQSLKRPVKLGKVERFSVNGLRFGASQIPATPTDPDRASVGAIDVGFNIPQMLLNRTLQLDLTLVNPDVYIEQDNNNRWIAGEISVASGSGPIKTEVRSVKVSNAKVVLVPNPKPANPRVPVGIPQLNGKAEFVDKGQRIRFDMGGQLATGGNFNVSGEHLPPSQQTNLQLQGQNLLITDLDRLVKLPLNLSAGRVDGNLTVRYNPAQPLFLLGMARLNDVTAKFQQLPAPFSNTNGVLNFSGQEIKLDNVATRLGQIPLQANGTFHTQNGYDISAQVPNVPIGNITQTLNLKTPVPISAEVRSQVRLTGPNQAPVLLGEFTTTKPAQVDKLQFSSISGRFAFAPATNEFAIANLQAKPTVGGQIIGKGNVKLGQGGGMVFDAEVQNVPGDAIAQQYGVTLSPSIKIGNVSAKAQVFGPLNDIRVAARWQAPQATYPAAGEVIIAKGQTVLRDATFKVAGNTLKAAARIADGRWEALVEGSQLPVKDILAVLPESIPAQEQRRNSQSPVPNPQSPIPTPIQQGVVSGRAKLSGSLASFKIADIQAIAEGSLQVAGGTVQLRQGLLEKGRWQALVGATGVQLGRFEQVPTQLQRSTLSNGQFKLAGNIESFQLTDIQSIGQASLNLAGGTVEIVRGGLQNGAWDAIVKATGVNLGQLAQVPAQVQGPFSGQFRVGGNLNSSELGTIQAVGQGNLGFAGGNLQIRELQLNQGNWRANIAASGVQLGRLTQVPPQLQGSAFNGQVVLAGNLDSLTAQTDQSKSPLSQIQAIAQGNLQVAGGNVQIRKAELNKGNFVADVIASGVQLNRFPQVPPQFQSSFSGQFQLAGNLDTLTTQSDKSPLSQIQAKGQGNLQVAGGNVRIRQAQLNEGNFQADVVASGVQLNRFPQVPKQLQSSFSGELQLAANLNRLTAESNQSPLSLIQARGQGNLQVAGGNVRIRQAQLNEGNFQADVVASGVQLNRFPQVPKQLQSSFSGELQLAGNLDKLTTQSDKSPLSQIQARGQGNLQVAGGNVRIRQAQLNEGNFQADIVASGVQLNRFPQVPKQLQSSFSGELQLAANLDTLTDKSNKSPLSQIQARGQGNLQFADGNLQIRQAELNKGNFQADVVASALQLSRFPQVLPQLRGSSFSGKVQLAGNLDNLTDKSNKSPLSQIQARVQGNLQLANGSVQIRDAQLNKGNFQADLVASAVQLSRFPQVPTQLRGSSFSGELQLAGNLDNLNDKSPLSLIQGRGQGNLQNVAGGSVTIRQVQIDRGNFQADVSLAQVQLDRFSNQLRGRFNGDLKLAGNLASLTATNSLPLSAIQAAGQVNFSEGIASIQGPIAATFKWNGQQLLIENLTSPRLNASGVIAANFDRNNRPNITAVDLNVDANNLNLQTLPIQLPNNIALAGSADFKGRISGTPTSPNVAGNLRLQNFVINGFDFDPILTGDVEVIAGRGVKLDVVGTQDRIAVELDRNYNPVTFSIRRDDTVAEGTKQGDLLQVNLQNFPIATLKDLATNVATLPPQVARERVNGQLSGNFVVNLNERSVVANNVAIAQPGIGNFKADSLSGDFRYANGIGEITNAVLRQGESSYGVTGRITPTDFQARVQVEQGKIQNVLTAFNLLNLQAGRGRPNNGRAANVQTVPVGIPEAPLLTQLRRFSEIEALLQQQRTRRRETNRIPDITELTGNFSGSIGVSGSLTSGINSLPTGLEVSFDLNGKDWELGDYKFNQVTAQGSFVNGVLRVNPLQIKYNDALLAFTGNLGLQQQSGQLQLQNFPVDAIKNFVPLPVEITGKLNGTANLAGTLENPQVIGDLTLVQGTLSGTPVQSAKAIFRYDNARLNFNSEAVVQPPQPILISGSIPYQLPFSSVKPDSDRISLDVNVENEGLALLNLLSRGQVSWQGGQGKVQLQVRGTLSAPQITGIAIVQDATIAAVVLPAPLTNVAGTARFDRDRIVVENLAGSFSKGAVAAQGTIAISRRLPSQDPDRANPLNVTLNNLTINLKGLYRGGVNGNVVITGTAFTPQIAGKVELANGEVFLGQQQQNAQTVAETGTPTPQSPIPGSRPIVPEFNNLQLTLANNVNVTRQPLFSFRATGDLTVNGLLGNLEPKGTIRLRRGQVNLFTTQMTLDRDYTQTAVFVPDRGLDPILDVRLVTTVPEVTGSRLPTSSITSEVADVPTTGFFGSVETVRVIARVQGPASQLGDNLVLTSNPPRTEAEIVGLIGGGFAQNLGRGDSTLGLANLAGSAVLSNQQIQGTITAIGQAFGLSELRLFPTAITTNREDRSRSSTLGLAAEAVVDITRQLSASVSKVLTTDQPLQYNLRYRVNNNILLRGSTDLTGESRGAIEFERRF